MELETQVWAIAVKGTSSEREFNAVAAELASIVQFKVPGAQLRVGTLDSLMSLSDDLVKMEILAEATSTKFYKQLLDLNPSETPGIDGLPVDGWLKSGWSWDEAKFQLKMPLRELCENISMRISSLDDELKLKMSEINALKGSLQGLERKTQGNLMVRGLADLIKMDTYEDKKIMDSEYMTAVYVVVPKNSMKDFEGYYESMCKYVVPKSAKLLAEDAEYGLYSVVLFVKYLDQFKAAAREKRLTLREFTYSPTALAEEAAKKSAESGALADLRQKMGNWCTINYGEVYTMMVHLKAVRVFVESVLRFGLVHSYDQGMVPNFRAYLVQPKKGKAEVLRKALGTLYSSTAGGMMDGEDEAVIPGATGEFYPYVYTAIETEPNLA